MNPLPKNSAHEKVTVPSNTSSSNNIFVFWQWKLYSLWSPVSPQGGDGRTNADGKRVTQARGGRGEAFSLENLELII